jgi:hypothetical protein
MTTTSPFLFDAVEPQYVDGPAARCACRRFGKTAAPPLVMCMRFRLDRSHAEILPNQVQAQITAMQGNKGLWDRVPELEHPVLVASGSCPLSPTSAAIAGTMRPERIVRSGRLRGL